MKKLIYLSLVTLLASACQNNTNETSANGKAASGETTNPEKVLVLPYTAGFNEKTQKFELKHTSEGDASKLSASDMVDAINNKYPEIKLQLVKAGHDTLYVKINDATYLSERLGSAGSKIYMAESTYALTEIAGVKVVDFDFTEGDHASPGAYTRSNF